MIKVGKGRGGFKYDGFTRFEQKRIFKNVLVMAKCLSLQLKSND
jgi:hypothetical protein